MKERFWKRKIIIGTVSAVLAVTIIFSLYLFLSLFRILVPYDGSQLSVTEIEGKIYAMYNGNDLGGSAVAKVNGQGTSSVVFYIYTTPWAKISSHFSKANDSNTDMIFIENANETDAIYYGEFNYHDYETDAAAIVGRSELIWGE